MRSAVGLLFALSAIISTASCLNCTSCTEIDTTSCTGDAITCPDQSVCGSLLSVSAAGNLSLSRFARGCFQPSQCNKLMVSTELNITMKQSISCCNTDNCTPTVPTWQDDNNQMNGFNCSTGQEILQCSGSEFNCFTQTTTSPGPDDKAVTVNGCANDNFCEIATYVFNMLSVNTNVTVLCAKVNGTKIDDGSIPQGNSSERTVLQSFSLFLAGVFLVLITL